MKPTWGLETQNPNARYCWGARAIYTLMKRIPDIDLVHDRQGMDGEATKEQRVELANWINNTGLKKLKEQLQILGVGTDSSEVVSVVDEKFTITASPRGSYGYLYIVAEPRMP